ncbi:MAG TPA: hypothetical protein VIV60_29735 [Polyangiaceae bacterium]
MKREFSVKISTARQRIDDAESMLRAAIAATLAAPRADKVTVSAAVNEALRQLEDARSILIDLETPDSTDENR